MWFVFYLRTSIGNGTHLLNESHAFFFMHKNEIFSLCQVGVSPIQEQNRNRESHVLKESYGKITCRKQ